MNDSIKPGLLGAFRRIMRPLVRILIRHGVEFDEFVKFLRSVYVESAQEDFRPSGRGITTARVSVLTGLDREIIEKEKEILASGDLLPKGQLNQITKLLVGWHSDPQYTGPYGLPIELDTQSADGPSFEGLAKTYCPQISSEAMLEELLQVGAVVHTPHGKLKVLMRAYIPDSLRIDGLERMGEVVANFVGTVETNMEKTRQGAGRFERVVYADDGIPPRLMPEFDKLLRTKGQQLLVELDNWIGSQNITPEDPNSRIRRNVRTGVGIYHYIESEK